MNSNEVNWSDAIWQSINTAVVKEMHNVRIAQKVFPTVMMEGDPTYIPDEVIDFNTNTIREGATKPFVELYKEFALTSAQVSKEQEQHYGRTLAVMAAKDLALAEDTIIFQGADAPDPLRGNVQAEQLNSMARGLLGLGTVQGNLQVNAPVVRKQGVLYGENTFTGVTSGIAELNSRAQAPNFAFFLQTQLYADTFQSPSDQSLVTTSERIRPLVEGGFNGTATLPNERGLLVALGGDPIMLYVGREASCEFVRKNGSQYIFRVSERIQFVVRDPRAIVTLQFTPVSVAARVPVAADGGAALVETGA